VHVIRFVLNRFAVLGVALSLPALALPAAAAAQATQTRLSAETRDTAGRTQANLSVAVEPDNAVPATGSVVIMDGQQTLAGGALDAQGNAQIAIDLLPGAHNLQAVYSGDSAHKASVSGVTAMTAAVSATPDFGVSITPATMSLTAGQSGNATASIIPVNASSLTSPMFVTLSCSGMPDQSSCSFTPTNVEILPNATTAVTSSLVVSTQAKGTRGAFLGAKDDHIALAILLPGTLGLAGFAFSVRRRRWLSRVSLIVLVGFVATVGTTACAPRYDYYNHGPNYNLPTPAGTYTVSITAQSSNGVTATTHETSFALTVN
jgi:hypothetical protein